MHAATAAILMLLATQAGSDVGQVTGIFGGVALRRGEDAVDATAGTGLEAGDVLFTSGDSGAALMLVPQASVFVGSQTRIALLPAGGTERVIMELDPGEIRVSPSGGVTADIRTLLASGECAGPGVLRVAGDADVVRFWAERGPSVIRLNEQELARWNRKKWVLVSHTTDDPGTLILQEGDAVEIRRGKGFGVVEEGDPNDWEIDPSEFAEAIIGGRGSRLQRSAEPAPPTPDLPSQDTSPSQSPNLNSQVSNAGGINITLGTSFSSLIAGASGGSFLDANQGTLSGQLQTGFGSLSAGSAFPGNIHLVTGETSYSFSEIALQPGDQFPDLEFWSIGIGPPPQRQVVTDVLTGTNPQPAAIGIPQFDAYIVRLDQFGAPDPAQGGTSAANLGVTGLVGPNPVSPGVAGATPLADERSRINRTATFAFGEFAVRRDGDTPVLAMRRSDQDRRIVKDPGGDDDQDQVAVNTDISQFNTTVDPRFFAPNRAVYVPARDSLRNLPRYSTSALVRKAGFTVLMAETMRDISRRTGQTRFVVDGQIVDITGYRP